jgi:hypothetical protein
MQRRGSPVQCRRAVADGAGRGYVPGVMSLWAIAAAFAADDGFLLVREAYGCTIRMRPEDHPSGAAMRAECVWPDVDPARLIGVIGDYERYDEFVSPVTLSRVERTSGDRTLVYQLQHMTGIADREVLLWMRRHAQPGGGVRVSWTTAAEEPLALQPGSVRTPKNVGYWEVVPDPAGGARVVHEIQLDAGGSIPRWLVSLVRTRGFARIMQDVRVFGGGS